MSKKLLSLLLILTVLLSFASCKQESRSDFSELLKRTEKYYGKTEIPLETAFFSEGKWFLFLSLCEKDDLLITGTEDEETNYLVSVSVTVLNTGNEKQKEEFSAVCKAVIKAFMPEEDVRKTAEKISLSDGALVFSDEVRFYTEGRYKLSFFNCEQSGTMIIELIY